MPKSCKIDAKLHPPFLTTILVYPGCITLSLTIVGMFSSFKVINHRDADLSETDLSLDFYRLSQIIY